MSTMVGDNEAAIDFLRKVYPDGPWVLTAIRTDKKAIDTKTFDPSSAAACLDWLELYNGERNIYWSTNPPTHALTKKAEREDIKCVSFLHVDIDPRAGEDLEVERERCAALFAEKLPASVPPPTAVIFSGGGYQGFWKLEEPIPIDGDLAKAEDAKRYNQQLELLFGGDNCHNIDRIMRLPGTVNLPDERKRKKGRTPQLASLVNWNPEVVYPLGKFTPAPAVQMPEVGGAAKKVEIGGNVERLDDINELDKWGVPDRVKVICVQGKHPEVPKEGDSSRSMWVFDAVCNLVRANVPDDVIFSILTDPDFGISESILENGRGAERYAIRQIERAKEEAEEPWLRKMNDDHFVVENYAGNCVVAGWDQENGDGHQQLSYQSFEAVKNRYCNISVATIRNGNPASEELGKWWLKHPRRCQYRALVFRPDREQTFNGYYNLWQGFGVEAKLGDWSLMQQHIREVLAAGDEESAQYILNWAAWAVQNPEKPAEVAMVFRGGHGVGKGVFARSLAKLFGAHGRQVTAPSQFAGKFNAHLRDACLLFADEAMVPKDKAGTSIIKALLTEPELQIEGKGRDLVQTPNHVKVVMASNDEWVAPVATGDRRFAVFDASDKRKSDSDYFKPLYAQMEAGGLEAMLHDLQSRDLGNWHPRQIVETQARNDQKNATLIGFERIWLDALRTGELPEPQSAACFLLRQRDEERPYVSTLELQEYGQKNKLPGESISMAEVGRLFNGMGFRKDENSRPRSYQLPSLSEARAAWDKHRAPEKWDATAHWARVGRARFDEPPF